MKFVKGFLVVLITYLAVAIINSFLTITFRGGTLSYILITESAIYYSIVFSFIPTVVLLGIIFWFLRTSLSFTVSKYFFKAKGKFDDLLDSFGMAHFPLIFSSLSIFLFFYFGNIGVLLSLFFKMFFSLLVDVFFVNALITFQNLEWKKSLLTIIITEAVVVFILTLLGPAYRSLVLPLFTGIIETLPIG